MHGLQRQFGADHLARHLGHQVDHFLALRFAVIGAHFFQVAQDGVDGARQAVQRHQGFIAAFFAAMRDAIAASGVVAVLLALHQAHFIAVALALLEAFRDGRLPLAIRVFAGGTLAGGDELRQRRKTV